MSAHGVHSPHLERWCPAYPHANSHATALVATRGPREPPPGHGPPAPHPYGPPASAGWRTPTQPRTSVPAVQPPRVALFESPQRGLSEVVPQASTPPAHRGFCTPTQCACWHPTSTQAHRAGTRPPPWYTAVVAPGGPGNSGSSQFGVHDTTHPAREPKRAHGHPGNGPQGLMGAKGLP